MRLAVLWPFAAVVLLAMPVVAATSAHAVTYACEAQIVLGYSGVVLDDWRAGADDGEQISFGLDTETGVYSEVMARSAGLMADVTLDIHRRIEGGSGVAIGMRETMIVKIEDSAHGVNYVRLGEEGLAEIGTCVKR